MGEIDTSTGPIFIHSLFRSGSTYLFQVFRRSRVGYWCYQEPFHEKLCCLNGNAEQLLESRDTTSHQLRHPRLERPYFWEYHQIREALAGRFRACFSYGNYFTDQADGLDPEQTAYLRVLVDQARGRPVLQCCRSSGRVGAIRRTMGGTHIHLWREPRNQWWSFQVNEYFNAALQLIYNSDILPPMLEETGRQCGVPRLDLMQPESAFVRALGYPIALECSYQLFYALWLYAYLESERHSDLTISIDRLSLDQGYQKVLVEELGQIGVEGLDFTDCSILPMLLSDREADSFLAREQGTATMFLAHGCPRSVLDAAGIAAEGARELHQRARPEQVRPMDHGREMALLYLGKYTSLKGQATKAQARAETAEARLDDILGSLTWKFTLPLRLAIRTLRQTQRWWRQFRNGE